MNNDRIAKEQLNVILLVDASKSMQGKRMKQVDEAIFDIKNYLLDLQNESSNVDFFMTIIPFQTEAYYYNNKRTISINEFEYNGIKAGGWSNLHLAYEKLGEILKKTEQGGIMPDFGGAAPIILLLTDGHPSSKEYVEKLNVIEKTPWFKQALRYGIAVELDDDRTIKVLSDFVGQNGDVITCYDSSKLKNIIKIIVITASKVKSSNTKVSKNILSSVSGNLIPNQTVELKQEIADALGDIDSWEW